MRILAAAVGSTVGLAMFVAGCGHQAQSAPVTSTPEQGVADTANRVIAAPVDPDPRVGAVFLAGGDLHACTGSVLHSAAGNLVLTAAHCLSAGAPATFVPGFARKAAPDDVWTVDAMYLDPRWVANKDPLADYAIARVSRPGGGSVEGQVGSALSLGAAPARGSRVSVVAYPAGRRRHAHRLSGQHRPQRRRLPGAAVRGPGRRHQRRALDQRLDRHRGDRWTARRRLRGESVLLVAVRPAHQPAFGACRGRRPG